MTTHANPAKEPLASPPVHQFYVRALDTFDANAFRSLRFEATLIGRDRRNFAATDEATWTLERWQEHCRATPHRSIFGAIVDGRLVGAMAAWRYDKRERTALWGNTYLREQYRRQRRALLLYQKREDWTRQNPHYDTAVFFIREGDRRSREIHESQGAVMFAEEPRLWSDGSTALACWYEKRLRSLIS